MPLKRHSVREGPDDYRISTECDRPFAFRRSGLSFPSLQRWFIHHVGSASQRALEIQAAQATAEWEPKGRRLEYIDIDIALMRELGQGFWGVSVLDVHENAEGPPEWERNSRNIESWHEAIRLRRALEDALRDVPQVQSSANVQNDL
jgi:hypothetical protein